jgi:hypothetical protein
MVVRYNHVQHLFMTEEDTFNSLVRTPFLEVHKIVVLMSESEKEPVGCPWKQPTIF